MSDENKPRVSRARLPNSSVTVTLGQDAYVKISEMAKRSNVSMAHVIRHALKMYYRNLNAKPGQKEVHG